ncbi:MAG: ATP-dependent RecD-like DNA helicase [Ruminococcaceae bacterium]|nr:ATP-dependent RecD-like DNA helicase [Oscillospiraceae bacterium]
MEQELELLRGTVCAVVFQNEENGYTVLKLDSEGDGIITVVGTIPLVSVGERLMITGKWQAHAQYGRQFSAEFLERLMPETKQQILAYLSSRTIRGIGPKTAVKIVDRFGENALEIIEHHPEQLAQIAGITMQKAKAMSEAFASQTGVRRLIEFLTSHGLSAQIAMRLYRSYGEYAIDEIRENPYLLTDGEFGAGFGEVDAFALSIGLEGDDERRVEAGVLFELCHNLGNGHVFLPTGKLIEATAQLLGLDSQTVAEALPRLGEQGRLIEDVLNGFEVSYLPEYYEAEIYLTERLYAMSGTKRTEEFSLDHRISDIERSLGISYANQQRQALRAAATHDALIITGGPGTGKTTTLAGILELFDALGKHTLLTAPTGRAAKRLSELTGRSAATIHRLLEAQINPETGRMCFLHDEEDPLKADAVIVDETSMVDLLLMRSLLCALPKNCTLILVGDPDQLPSVGAGNVFSDLIRSGVIETVRLTEIFRQARESLIVMNAHAVNHGELPVLNVTERDFFFMKRRSGESLVQTISELCAHRLPKNMGIDPQDIQVLSPTRKGITGTKNLNLALQQVLNPMQPGKKEKKYGEICFREGDRVMQIRNNYDIIWKRVDSIGVGAGIFNGDIGTIQSIDHAMEQMVIVFDDRETVYSFDLLPELELAYAMTVHKSQGSEYRAVILSAMQGSPYLLTRSILYTAITRARELLIIVGDEQVIAAMTCNDRQTRRYSGLKLRLAACEDGEV